MYNFQVYLPEKKFDFVGREAYLKDIDLNLEKSQILTIVAFAGTGKSTLALEYAYAVNENHKYQPKWFSSDSNDKLEIEYKNFALELNIVTSNQKIEDIIKLLNLKLNTH